MSVGGWIIEIKEVVITNPHKFNERRSCVRLWVVDRDGTETIVFAELAEIMPKIRDNIWWTGNKIFFDNDRRTLVKIGNSSTAPTAKGTDDG